MVCLCRIANGNWTKAAAVDVAESGWSDEVKVQGWKRKVDTELFGDLVSVSAVELLFRADTNQA